FRSWADNSSSDHNKFDIFAARVDVQQFNPSPSTTNTAVSGIQFTGSANAVLPINVDLGFTTLPTHPKVIVNWSDLSDITTLNVDTSDFSDLAGFDGLSFKNVLDALHALLSYLSNLQNNSVLGTKLPLINKKVTDLVSFADTLVQKVDQLEANPQQSLQAVQKYLRDTLDLPIT